MSNRNKISTVLGIIGLVFGLYSYFLVGKNNVVLIPTLVCLSIVLTPCKTVGYAITTSPL